jgi:tRNA U38,U39,U40 pseudouridine synthase TruA
MFADRSPAGKDRHMIRRITAAVATVVRENWTPDTRHQLDAAGRTGIARHPLTAR